jgi:ArsR family transcriptional regulator
MKADLRATHSLKALADPTRLRILRVLSVEELTVGELTALLGMTQSRVSGHLAVLRDAEMVADRRQGTSAFYSLADAGAGRSMWDAVSPTLVDGDPFSGDRIRLEGVLAQRRERDREFFDRVSAGWDAGRSESLGQEAGSAALAGLLPRGLVAADLGTGTGSLLPQLAHHLEAVWAVDSSAGMLRRAAERVGALGIDNVRFVRGDLERVPLGSACVDGAVANMVLHHLADPEAALREMARVLRDNGRGVIVDLSPHDEAWLLEEEGHRWPGFAPAQIGGWCLDAGLSVPAFQTVLTPDSGRWSRLEVFVASFGKRRRSP